MTPTRETLDALARGHGPSFFLLDRARFAANYDSLLGAIRQRYARSQLAYSYKTNYLPALCRMVEERGGYAEVVSPMEYRLARTLGVAPARIVYNGPWKPADVLRRALLEGAMVNLDSAGEIAILRELAAEHPQRRFACALRCNFDPGDGSVSRFGFDHPALQEAVAAVRALSNATLEGLHCHYATRDKSARSYAVIAERMLELAEEVFGAAPPRYLNLGGGFFSPMPESFRAQFGVHVPSFDEYAEALAAPFARRYGKGEGPELILEPGICLVADAMRFCTPVTALKTIAGKRFAVVAGSVYDVKPTKHAKNLPLTVVPGAARGETVQDCDITGNTCMEDDVLHRGYGGRLAEGDYLVFGNVGGYSMVLKPPFIFPAAPVLALDASGSSELVRRAERYEDIFGTFPT